MIKIYKILLAFFFLISINSNAQSPYVLLISFDGFRWDYINRGITPNLDKLISNGVSASSLKPAFPTTTFPNHLSIITGMYPQNHGIISNDMVDWTDGCRFSIYNSTVHENKWYQGEAFWETCRKNNIISASYFWPGSENELNYRRANYFEHYDHKRPYIQRIDGVVNWFKLPDSLRPHFVTLYFDDVDSKAHEFGTKSNEMNQSIQLLDSLLGVMVDKLNTTPVKDSLNIIIVSDHGMADLSSDKIINLKPIYEKFSVFTNYFGSYALIQPKKHEAKMVYDELKQHQNHYQVFKKADVPSYYHFKANSYIPEIVVIADNGWIVSDTNAIRKDYHATHGYDNNWLDMHGVFYASGPNFKSNYKVGMLESIDIYLLLCDIFGIIPSDKTDGDFERIKFILKDK